MHTLLWQDPDGGQQMQMYRTNWGKGNSDWLKKKKKKKMYVPVSCWTCPLAFNNQKMVALSPYSLYACVGYFLQITSGKPMQEIHNKLFLFSATWYVITFLLNIAGNYLKNGKEEWCGMWSSLVVIYLEPAEKQCD